MIFDIIWFIVTSFKSIIQNQKTEIDLLQKLLDKKSGGDSWLLPEHDYRIITGSWLQSIYIDYHPLHHTNHHWKQKAKC